MSYKSKPHSISGDLAVTSITTTMPMPMTEGQQIVRILHTVSPSSMESANSKPTRNPAILQRTQPMTTGQHPGTTCYWLERKWLGLVGGWMVHVVGSWKEDILFGTRGFLDLV